MSKTFDTYCADVADLESARLLVEEALTTTFSLHESDFWGGLYYSMYSADFGKITIRRNENSYTGELNEPEFSSCPIIISVSGSLDPTLVEARLLANGLRLLSRTVV